MSDDATIGGKSSTGYMGTQGVIMSGGPVRTDVARLPLFTSMQATFDEAEMFTCTVEIECTTLVSGSPVPIAAIATVEWAIKGFQVRRKFDVGSSASISGVAQAVKATLVDTSPSTTPGGIPYRVTVMCAPGTRPGHLPPTLTPSPVTTVPPGGSLPVPVPQGIGVRSVQFTAASLTATSAVPAIARAQYQPPSDPPVVPPPVDLAVWRIAHDSPFLTLPPGTQTIVVQNLDATHAILAGVTFGIDG